MSKSPRILIFRFSSFGDVLQSLSIVGKISQKWPHAEIHFCTRSEFVPLIESHPAVHRVWTVNKEDGVRGLFELSRQLRKVPFTHIYDSHNNLRTHVLSFLLNGLFGLRQRFKRHQFLRRPIYRWKRFLLFQFKMNTFPQPFSGQGALLEPLKKWGFDVELPTVPQLFFASGIECQVLKKIDVTRESSIALAPSAAFALKRWPLAHFKKLIELLPNEQFIVLGGPGDGFAQELEQLSPGRVKNLAGQLSLVESSFLVSRAKALVSNDTGLMHVAEQTGTPCVALMGPAPFGFPSRPQTRILEKDLSCRPCSKHGQGPCVNKETFQKCLVDIDPMQVVTSLKGLKVLNG